MDCAIIDSVEGAQSQCTSPLNGPAYSDITILDHLPDMEHLPQLDFSDDSSELSPAPSRSATPPSDTEMFLSKRTPTKSKRTPYISPPSSQDSSRTTPCPDASTSGNNSSAEEGERPRKRRRLTPTPSNMPRDTKRLDLHDLDDPEQAAQLERLTRALKTKRKIVVVAGAGISTSAGSEWQASITQLQFYANKPIVPDFRSSTGLFKSLKAQNNLRSSGKDLFSANVYRDDNSTSQFHDMVRSLHRDTKAAQPTQFHHLVARLAKEGRLLRLYSQNVDGIDTSLPPLKTEVPLPMKAPWPNTIQLHGGLEKMVCTKCATLSDFDPDLFDGADPPNCQMCEESDFARTEIAGKRSHGVGRLRPRMVLYDERNPDEEAIGKCSVADLRRRPDCIIVVGTTLKIPGVRRIVEQMCKTVRDHKHGLSVWVNNDPEPAGPAFKDCWDIIVKGTSDQVADHASLLQWDDESEDLGVGKLVSTEHVQMVKEKGNWSVAVESPKKPQKIKLYKSLPTPTASPILKPADTAPSSFAAPAPSTFQKPFGRNPASRGMTIESMLNPPLQPKKPGRPPGPSVPRWHPDDAPRTSQTKKPSVPVTKKQPTAKKAPAKKKPAAAPKTGQLNFPVTKNTIVKRACEAVEKLKPLETSPTRENIPSSPRAETSKKTRPTWLKKGV